MQQITSFDSLLHHLEEADGDYARSSLDAYFFKRAYTGSSFDSLCSGDKYRFTADDIVAVSMLSVNIPPSATRWILGDGQHQLTELLKGIDKDLSIHDPEADLTKGKNAWNLWREIHSLWGVGETMASKLLATKRPFLFPIYDKHVARSLKLFPANYWQPWQDFIRSESGEEATRIVIGLAKSIGKESLSPLRLLDVVVWMHQHGHKFITNKLVAEGKMIHVNYHTPSDLH